MRGESMSESASEIARRLEAKRTPTGWLAKCPAHEDSNPSLSIGQNEDGKLLLHCHAGCSYEQVAKALGVSTKNTAAPKTFKRRKRVQQAEDPKPAEKPVALPQVEEINQQHAALVSNEAALAKLLNDRRWSREDINQLKIGWNGKRYVLPIYCDGKLVNVRYYLPGANLKMKNTKGKKAGHLFPEYALGQHTVWVVEGEPDALAARKLGLNATSFTSGASTQPKEQIARLSGHRVVICYDSDEAGEKGADKLISNVRKVTDWVKSVDVSEVMNGAGKDVTDAILNGARLADFEALEAATPWFQPPAAIDTTVHRVTVTDLIDGGLVGKRVEFYARVIGEAQDQFYVPKTIRIACPDVDRQREDKKCMACMMALVGAGETVWVPDVNDWLNLLRVSDSVRRERVGMLAKIACKGWSILEEEDVTVSELIITEPIATSGHRVDEVEAIGMVQRHVFARGARFDINASYRFEGMVMRRPWDQAATAFLTAHERLNDEIDEFTPGDEELELLAVFDAPCGHPG
jgi:5S rRNA maturation endonuclease (ribonuclease M5)